MSTRLGYLWTAPCFSSIVLPLLKRPKHGKGGDEGAGKGGNENSIPHDGTTTTLPIHIRTYQIGVHDADAIARLEVENFRGKFSYMVGDDKLDRYIRGVSLMHQKSMTPKLSRRTFVAECDGKPVGLLRLKFYDDPSSLDGTMSFVKELDIRAMLRLLKISFWFSRMAKIKPNECFIDSICVDENFRNKGIGKRLLEKADEESRQNNCNRMVLFMVHGNSAQRLYQRQGYGVTGEFSGYMLRTSLGVAKYLKMEKNLTES